MNCISKKNITKLYWFHDLPDIILQIIGHHLAMLSPTPHFTDQGIGPTFNDIITHTKFKKMVINEISTTSMLIM